MKKELNESIKFLLSEYKRLELKKKNNNLTKEEKETLESLRSFIGNKENG
jgi:hypothetical protein